MPYQDIKKLGTKKDPEEESKKRRDNAFVERSRAKPSIAADSDNKPKTTVAATVRYPLPQSGQAKPESVKAGIGQSQSGQAKPESTTPHKKASYTKVRSKPKGSVGAASNRDLPGRTVITYRSRSDAPASTTDKPSNYGTSTNKPPASDRAARIAKAQAAAKAHKASDYRRGGAAARSRAMNRND